MSHASGTMDFSDISALFEPVVRKIALNMVERTPTLLVGPPGTGKTMLARRLSTLLPALRAEELARLVEIYSRVSSDFAKHIDARPFRAPHHTISVAAITGQPARGGFTQKTVYGEIEVYPPRPARPGEVELASYGVLFLDEIVEFGRQALREIVRAIGNPMRIDAPYLTLATNPCFCGWSGSSIRSCSCTPTALRGYEQRLDQIQDLFGARRVTLPYIEPLRLEQHGACASSETIAREVGL